MTAIKICGLTRPEDVAAACELGAAIIGFNFAQSSPRKVTAAAARLLAAAVPPGVARAGVFVGEARGEIERAVGAAGLHIVQLHRPVADADFRLGADVVPAVPVDSGGRGLPDVVLLARCRAILWDSSAGRGIPADWSRLETPDLPVPVFVAGGLDADNVGDVIRRLRPAGVDVASGVESAPGVKDRRKLDRFFAAVREADRG